MPGSFEGFVENAGDNREETPKFVTDVLRYQLVILTAEALRRGECHF